MLGSSDEPSERREDMGWYYVDHEKIGINKKIPRKFHRVVVQLVIMYGLEIWGVTIRILGDLEWMH